MGRFAGIFIAGALAVLGPFASGARAADADLAGMIEDAPALVEVESAAGWYLRGDIGYSLQTDDEDGFDYRSFDGTDYSSSTFDSVNLSEEFSFGLGAGYAFNDWLRADVTVDRFTADFEGAETGGFAVSTDLAGYSAMLNGYIDLGTFVGFTPYVGAGIGSTYLDWDGFEDSLGASHDGESDWRFTYALMAGVAYDVSERLKIDLGYRYRNVDGGDMFGWDSASAAAGASGVQGEGGGLSTHEIRVGLRYTFR